LEVLATEGSFAGSSILKTEDGGEGESRKPKEKKVESESGEEERKRVGEKNSACCPNKAPVVLVDRSRLA
jgi:hypothetical protein